MATHLSAHEGRSTSAHETESAARILAGCWDGNLVRRLGEGGQRRGCGRGVQPAVGGHVWWTGERGRGGGGGRGTRGTREPRASTEKTELAEEPAESARRVQGTRTRTRTSGVRSPRVGKPAAVADDAVDDGEIRRAPGEDTPNNASSASSAETPIRIARQLSRKAGDFLQEAGATVTASPAMRRAREGIEKLQSASEKVLAPGKGAQLPRWGRDDWRRLRLRR